MIPVSLLHGFLAFFFLNLNLLVSTNHAVCFWLYGCSSQKIRLNCYLFFFQSRRKSASGQQPCWFRRFTTEKLLSRIHYWLCMNTRRACNKRRWNVSHAPWWVAAACHKSHPWNKDSDQTKSLSDFWDYKMPLNSNVHHHLCSSSDAWIYLMTEKLQENVKVFIREADVTVELECSSCSSALSAAPESFDWGTFEGGVSE